MTANEFIEKYGISTTFEQLYTIQRKMNRGSNFTFKDSAFIKKNYVHGLQYMLSAYMAKHTSPRNRNLQLSDSFEDFGFVQFLRDYESAMQDEFAKSGSTRDRKPFEGVRNLALETVKKQMVFFNDTLKEIWIKSIRKGAHLDVFREASLGALAEEANNGRAARRPEPKMNFINQAEDIGVEEHFRMVKASDDVKISTQGERLTPAFQMTFAVYKTMEEVINRRTWGWRLNPFNWRRLREENQLMRDVKEKLVESLGEDGLQRMSENEDSVLGDFSQFLVLHTERIIEVDGFLNKLKSGEIESISNEKEIKELEKLSDELNKDEVKDNDILEEPDDKFEDLEDNEIEEDFENLKSDSKRNLGDERAPDVYIPSKENADEFFLLEDSREEAKNIKPANEELVDDPDNVVIMENIAPEAEFKQIGVPNRECISFDGEFNDSLFDTSAKVEDRKPAAHNKTLK